VYAVAVLTSVVSFINYWPLIMFMFKLPSDVLKYISLPEMLSRICSVSLSIRMPLEP